MVRITLPQQNQLQNNTVDAVKELIWSSYVKSATLKIFVAVPILGWPPFALLINHLILTYSDFLYDSLKAFLSEEMILFKNKRAEEQFKKSALLLNEIAKTKGIDSKEYRETRNENKKLLENLVRYDAAK